MRLGIVGCGFVADFYAASLRNHGNLGVAGVFDRNPERLRQFCEFYGLRQYTSLDEVLADPAVDIVVNLTTPDSHYEITLLALEAGKHVYSEKPLALDLAQAKELAATAERRGLGLASAPSSLLGPTAQTLWKGIRTGAIGSPKLVYAELDDGAVHQKRFWRWTNRSGALWPARKEFELGCTIEHAAYYLTWLTTFFGPVRQVGAMAACLYPDKGVGSPIPIMAPDVSIGVMMFESGVLGRLTCSIVAPTNRSLMIVGEEGLFMIDDAWNYGAGVRIRRRVNSTGEMPDRNLSAVSDYPLVHQPNDCGYEAIHQMDFAAGIAELAESRVQGRRCRLSVEHAIHVLEVTFALQSAVGGATVGIQSNFVMPDPMPWAI